jgi:hypothetical protein
MTENKKYCIYRKPWGDIESWEYIDDLDEAKSYWYVRMAIDQYGAENVMPVCMNKMGGYHTFYKPDCIAIIESDTWPSLSSHYDLFKGIINSSKFNYGWIDHLGNTYSCQYMGHASLASELVTMNYKVEYTNSALVESGINAPDDFLLKKGWIKVISGNPSHIYFDQYVSDVALAKLLEIEKNK